MNDFSKLYIMCIINGVITSNLAQYFLEKDIIIHINKTWCDEWKYSITHKRGICQGYSNTKEEVIRKAIIEANKLITL